jgi:HD superfamily phosphohydrolase
MKNKGFDTPKFHIGRKIKIDNRTFIIKEYISRGKSGDVYKVESESNDRDYAIKVFIPYYQIEFQKELFEESNNYAFAQIRKTIDLQRQEYDALKKLKHPNIVKVEAVGEIEIHKREKEGTVFSKLDKLQFPVILMEWINGKSLFKTIEENNFTINEVSQVLFQIADALVYLHKKAQILHCDIKSDNILVETSPLRVKIIDFALCKNFNDISVDDRIIPLEMDWDLFPKLGEYDPLKLIKEKGGKKEELRELAFPSLDNFQLGILLEKLLEKFKNIFEKREIEYLKALSNNLTAWKGKNHINTLDVKDTLSKLRPDQFLIFGVPELSTPSANEKIIMLPCSNSVPISNYVNKIISNPSFRRLFFINQLCLLNNVYPAADYKRAVHSLHTYYLARQFVSQLYSSPSFRLSFNEKESRQLLIIALLHDINHFPFLHIFQESGIESINSINLFDLFCNGEITGEKKNGFPSIFELLSEIDLEPERFKRLIINPLYEQKGKNKEVDMIISSIINSGADLDKMSYLTLDSYFTGVPYGSGLDIQCLLKSINIATINQHGRNEILHIAYENRAIQATENLVMSRYWNFRSIYWHHTNRGIMSMILHVVRKLFISNKIDLVEFIESTMWKNDYEVIDILDKRHNSHYGYYSILHEIAADRSKIYKRIFTIQSDKEIDFNDITDRLITFSYQKELLYRKKIAQELKNQLSKISFDPTEEDILIDMPRRKLDSGGNIFINNYEGEVQPLESISAPVRTIKENYEKLAKKSRIFCSPKLVNDLFSNYDDKKIQEVLQDIIKNAIINLDEVSEIK